MDLLEAKSRIAEALVESIFQPPQVPLRQTVDLDQLDELRIFRNNVEDHEELVHRIMGLLTRV